MEDLRNRLRTEGFSEESSSLLLESRRAGTKLAYAGPWKKWCGWCRERRINPVQTTVGNIGNFLTSQAQRGLEYSTLNTYRSAISAYHQEIDGHAIGQHPRIKQLLKGAFNRKPPSPRYITTWNVDTVLTTIRNLGTNETLSMKQLSQKLAMLIALVSTSRGSELTKLDPSTIDDLGDRIKCRVTGLTKVSNPKQPYKSLILLAFDKDPLLDVVSCLRLYIDKTKPFRQNEKQIHQLFLAYNKPHHPVVTCSIARWLKCIMAASGIDTTVYKAHSTRAASTSKGVAQGLSVQQIMENANWVRASTFQKFYNKPILQSAHSTFQKKVLTL